MDGRIDEAVEVEQSVGGEAVRFNARQRAKSG
jgi:hypothetical protein